MSGALCAEWRGNSAPLGRFRATHQQGRAALCWRSVPAVVERAASEVFDSQLDSWHAWQRTPWGRIRYRVVAETLRRTCGDLGNGPLQVLDVGGGDGGDALPLAEAGHRVTIVDYSRRLLEEARAAADERGVGERISTVHADLADLEAAGLDAFDLVLCHNVVQYQQDTAAVISSLVRFVNPHGALSMMAVNPPSDVLTAAIREADLQQATQMRTASTTSARTFGHEVRRVSPGEVEAALNAFGFRVIGRYGIRVVVDYITDDARKHDAEFYGELEHLELSLCDQEPYLRIARLWQLVARRATASRPGAEGTR
jgi:2-polyprenyl-3-methyl-5-hydroxy-6-metoxy-1,4-benzoquinol methylase